MKYVATTHAVERYIERVRPSLPPKTAKLELERLARQEGVLYPERPECLPLPSDELMWDTRDADGYLELGDTGIFCIVLGSRLLTVVHRGGLSEEGRVRRNERKQRKRKSRRSSRQFEAWLGERDRRR